MTIEINIILYELSYLFKREDNTPFNFVYTWTYIFAGTYDVITIVAMFTIVAINHNFRNTNHNCRKKPQLSQLQSQLSQSDQPQMSQQQPQLSQFFRKKF